MAKHMAQTVLEWTKLGGPVRLTMNEEKETLLSKTIKKCKHLYGDEAWYYPTPWLADGNAATAFCTVADFSYESCEYTRFLLRVPDGGTISIDVTPRVALGPDGFTPDASVKLDSRPLLVACHGLTGGSHESYVVNVLEKITRPKSEDGPGWRGAVVNFRGCAGTRLTTRKLYSGEYTHDLRCAMAFLRRMSPEAPLYGVGFSLGANVLAKYLGEESKQSPFSAAVIMGPPWDFIAGSRKLESTPLKRVYSRAMAKNLRTLLLRHEAILKDDPRLHWDDLFSQPNQSLYDFDNQVTAPFAGHKDADEYYRSASALNVASSVITPLLSISALDDPIVATSTVPLDIVKTNENIAFALTDAGGHLGWFENFLRPRRWIWKPVVEFFTTFDQLNGSSRADVKDDLVQDPEHPGTFTSPSNDLVGFTLIEASKEEAVAGDLGGDLVQGL